MITLWRISDHIDLEGSGGRFFASRWSSQGRRIVYLAESPAGAMLEILVHLPFRNGKLPQGYTLLQVRVPDDCGFKALNPSARSEWRNRHAVTRKLGDMWMASAETPLARIPSAIMPHTWNYLLNPEHPDAKQVQIAEVIKERFDNRLFRFGAR
ncbi:MAG: RES family NAD+ phosphorylase [Terracidiphilus sp.]|jgi:RES domain-containing protein